MVDRQAYSAAASYDQRTRSSGLATLAAILRRNPKMVHARSLARGVRWCGLPLLQFLQLLSQGGQDSRRDFMSLGVYPSRIYRRDLFALVTSLYTINHGRAPAL